MLMKHCSGALVPKDKNGMSEVLVVERSFQALPYRSWVEVSRAQIAANFQAIKQVVGEGVEVMPVVKADAYRHGAIEVSRVLEEHGARWLAKKPRPKKPDGSDSNEDQDNPR